MAYRRRVQTIFEWLAPQDDDHILDGGCGRGFYLKFIRHVCKARLAGVELEFPYLRIARKALAGEVHLTLVNGSLYDLPFPAETFDKAILSEVLEHVDDDVRALQSVTRVLKPGGLIAITVPNADYPFWWDPINKTLEALFKTHIRHGLLAGIWAYHVRLYTRDQLREAVLSAGLEIVEERRFTHHCFPFIHNIVYGLGKTVLEAGLLPVGMADAADRHNVDGQRGGPLNPINMGLRLFEWFDRNNLDHEPSDRSTVNLCILARKPAADSNQEPTTVNLSR
ncbi:MAG: class I SAM-dependent methyltransferase [Anaerolineae bacterium]|nr:class I SAM-dependent methyltransferase [Anaerolineae bacterium]